MKTRYIGLGNTYCLYITISKLCIRTW